MTLIDQEARNLAASANRGVNDLYGQLGGIAADCAATRRDVSEAKRVNAAVVAVGIALIGALTQFQVARLNAPRAAQVDVATEQARQRDLVAVEARLSARVDAAITEVERLRRNAPAPLGRGAEVVTGR